MVMHTGIGQAINLCLIETGRLVRFLLEALQILARHRLGVAVVFHHGAGLQGMNHVVQLRYLNDSARQEVEQLIGYSARSGPVAVKPDTGNFAVVAQFADLAVEEAQVVIQAPLSWRKRKAG